MFVFLTYITIVTARITISKYNLLFGDEIVRLLSSKYSEMVV